MDEAFSYRSFDWDTHNVQKNWDKHRVSFTECEEVFFDPLIKITTDEHHSSSELRYFALGKTKMGRLLFVVFTERGEKIRVISARDINKKERRIYHEKSQKGT